MENDRLRIDRRSLLLAACIGPALAPLSCLPAKAQAAHNASGTRLDLEMRAGTLDLRPGTPPSPVWSLNSGTPGFVSHTKRGAPLAIVLSNALPVPAALEIRGLDGAAGAEPLTGQPALPAGDQASLALTPAQAGTFLLDPRLLNDGRPRAILPLVLIVEDDAPGIADHDEVLLIEDWRLGADGAARAAGHDAAGAAAFFTVNRLITLDIPIRRNARLRLRLVNGCQRAIIAVKIPDHDVRVMAIDSMPAEPFITRAGEIVLAPGTRVDALLDATQPAGTASTILLHDGVKAMPIARIVTSDEPPLRVSPLPDPAPPVQNALSRIDLKGALRVDLSLDPAPAPVTSLWRLAADFDKTAPLLRVRRGRTVVLAITNKGPTPATFHLHGHHFRLLDRMDDGWKPFWLDTLMFNPGQTQRIAFAADYAGKWLLETMGNDWSAPRLLRWYAVE